jgi:phosphoribosylglycinamide formyltransferase-1
MNHISLARNLGFHLNKYGEEECDEYLVGGCGIIPGLKAINAHPGYLPIVRGLDALKWAIYRGVPIGVTIHRTSDIIDEGEIISRHIVPLYYEDTFHSLAYRLYNTEIEMLVNAINTENSIEADWDEITGPLHLRMPPYKERIMLERFEKWRKKSPSIYDV